MAAWRYLGIVTLGLVPACGLPATGELPSGLDAGQLGGDSTTPKLDATGGSHMKPDATADAGGKKHDGGGGTKHDGSPQGDAPSPPDGSTQADAGDSGSAVDAGDAGSTGDAGEDAGTGDAGHDAGAHDAGVDAMTAPDAGSGDAGVDASAPPGGCFYDYSCGSAKCGCNQLCDDGTTCGACLPHFGTCGLDAHDCDTDFSSTLSCGGCGNICTCLNPFSIKCNKTGTGGYACGC
jgi:hypothetical protein